MTNCEWTAQKLIDRLEMQPHVEGGWFRAFGGFGVDIPKSALPPFFKGERNSVSHIYYLLQPGEESAWHQLHSAEQWLWHCGGTLETVLGGEGNAPREEKRLRLGPNLDEGETFSFVIPARQWQTTRLVRGSFALVSCVVSPAFHYDDFYMPEK